MSFALHRLRNESREYQNDIADGKMIQFLGPDPELGDPFKWKAIVNGPPDSPYENGKFIMKITVPEEYPLVPPKVLFGTQIYHPNILGTGEICLDILDVPELWNE